MNWIKRFVADLNTVAFSSVANQFLWVVGSLALTVTACVLLLRQSAPIAIVPNMDPGAAAMAASVAAVAHASVESARQIGKEVAYALLFAWTGKSLVTAGRDAIKRNTDWELNRIRASGPPKVEVETVEQVTVDAKASPLKGERRINVGEDAAVNGQPISPATPSGMDDSRTDDERASE